MALAGDPDTAEPENFEDDDAVCGVDGSGDPIGNPTGQLTINNSVISYHMTEDSANDIIDRINSADNQDEAYLSADNRLVIKGSQENDYELSELRDSGLLLDKANVLRVGGEEAVLELGDVEGINEGQQIGVFGDNQATSPSSAPADIAEITQVESVNEEAGTVTVDLANDYNTGGNVQVTSDFGGNFNVNDEASQQITDFDDSGPEPIISLKSAEKFGIGDEIRISFNDGTKAETATVTAIDTDADESTVDGLGGSTYTAGNAAVQTSEDTNENRNLLSVLGMDRRLTEKQEGTEFAIEGSSRRPPVAEQVASFEVSDRIQNNPDLIAAASGNDVDLDGVDESSLGPGDGSNTQALSSLKSTGILENGTTSPDEKINELITNIGSESSLVQREQSVTETLVNDIERQRQQISGVNIDEELTRMLQHLQVFQASSRMIQTVDQLNQSILQIL